MGPRKAAEEFLRRAPEAQAYEVVLYGSLAATGKGHMTDAAIIDVFEKAGKKVDIVWQPDTFLPRHPNAIILKAFDTEVERQCPELPAEPLPFGDISCELSEPRTDEPLFAMTVYSLGGGAIEIEGDEANAAKDIYPMNKLHDILDYCEQTGKCYWEYVEECEGPEIWPYLSEVWHAMRDAVERGIQREGRLPGPLNLRRKAAQYYTKATGYRDNLKSRGLTFSYALAVSEENASGGVIVTAPTCGSCGVIPGVLYHIWKSRELPEIRVLRALATAGLIGNVVKENASIAGAEVGCQGEVGVACAMAAAAANQLFGGSPAQIEYAAEMGLEHHLGMTCDPVCGLVQIPCIERNAYAAARALDANIYSSFSDGVHRVSFDKLVEVMKETGHDLPSLYKETGTGGLAKDYRQME